MTSAKLFLIAAGFSAIGALPVGMINLSVAERTIHRGSRAGLMVALGACVIELCYTYIALYFIDFFVRNEAISQVIKTIAIFIFLVLALYYWSRKVTPSKQSDSKYPNSRNFGLGVGVAAINMLIIPYWIFLGLWLKANGLLFDSVVDISSLAIGSMMGALLVFLLYIRLGRYIVGRMEQVSYYTNKALAILFLSLAIIQLVRVVYTG
ncbi:MAG: LysE family transporter [Saprospiraceae bacterium]|nr:LysE family transporter [Saprospiraceae bacterium]